MTEIARVSGPGCEVEFRFPIDDGYKRDFLSSWSKIDFSGMLHAYSTRKNRAHSWIMNPGVVSARLVSLGFSVDWRRNPRGLFFPFWVFLPRWRKVLPGRFRNPKTIRKLEGWARYFPKLNYEWVLTAIRS